MAPMVYPKPEGRIEDTCLFNQKLQSLIFDKAGGEGARLFYRVHIGSCLRDPLKGFREVLYRVHGLGSGVQGLGCRIRSQSGGLRV